MDYLLFLQGFYLLLCSILFLFLAKVPPLRALVLPLSLFGFFYAVHAGLQIAAELQNSPELFVGAADFYALAVVLMLYIAGSRSLFRSWKNRRLWLLWLLPPVIFLGGQALTSAIPPGPLAIWAFGLPGALMLGAGLRMIAQQFQGELRSRLVFLAYGFAAFAVYFLLTAGQLTLSVSVEELPSSPWLHLLGVGLAFYLLFFVWQTYELTHHPEFFAHLAQNRFSLRGIILPLFLLASFLGWVFTQWLGAEQEKTLVRALLLRTALIEDALRPEHLEQLPPNLRNPDHPAHEEVRKTLSRFTQYMAGAVEVFLLTRDTPQGTWYFLADSNDVGEEGYLPPGRPFRRQNIGLDWGSILSGEAWVSPSTLTERGLTRELLTRLQGFAGTRPLILGVRLEEKEIKMEVARERLIGIAVTLCFLGLLSGAYATNRVHESASRAIEATRHHLLLALESAGLSTWEYHPSSSLFSLQHPLSRFSARLPSQELQNLEEFFALLPASHRNLARQQIRELEDGLKDEFALELPVPTDSNEDFWLWWKGGVSQRDSAGRPRLLSGTLQSIQERIATQAALEKSRESLRQVVATVSEVIFETDADGAWTFLNPAWTELSGASVRESLGQSINRFLGLDRNQAVRRKLAAFLAGTGDELFHETILVPRADVAERWVEITANRLARPDGRTRGMVGTLRDVTAQRRNQRILESIVLINTGLISTRLEMEGWQYSLRLLGEAAYVQSAWVAQWSNGLFQPQAHWSDAEQNVPSLPSSLPDYFHFWREEMEQGRELIAHLDNLPAPLQSFFQQRQTAGILAVPVFCGVDFWGMLCFETGLVSRVWGREELALLRSAAAAFGLCLARQRGDDALQEATDQARRAAEAAEAANRAKSAFLATMSHEIRTPLNAVIGMASLLQESNLTPQQQEFAGTVVGASKSLLDLINDILDYSKIEAGKIELHLEEVNLAELCMEALELMSAAALAKGLRLEYNIPPRFPLRWRLDRVRVRQILLNLLSNAVKFTARGHVSISLESFATSEGHQRCEIRISDTGIGIPAQTLPRLFTPFLQADSSITRKYGGTGLGLAITKRLLEAMGGQIEVEKSTAEGTDFLISLEARVEDASPWFQPSVGPPDSPSGEVILALSAESTQRLIEVYLTGLQWKVRKADSFPALTRCLDEAPSGALVIVDRDLLPARGQQELTQLAHAVQEKSLRVILLADRPQDLAPGLRNLLDGCLPRFFRLPSLFAILNKSLDLANSLEVSGIPSAQSSRSAGAASDQSSRLADLRILVAEDNPNNQKVLRLMLRKMGCHLQMVENGLQAVQAATKGTFDLVILDLQMPIMDGLTAVGRLRDHFRQNNLPSPVMMALTANAFEEDRAACLAAGFDRYLAKPVSASQLREAIEDCLPEEVLET